MKIEKNRLSIFEVQHIIKEKLNFQNISCLKIVNTLNLTDIGLHESKRWCNYWFRKYGVPLQKFCSL